MHPAGRSPCPSTKRHCILHPTPLGRARCRQISSSKAGGPQTSTRVNSHTQPLSRSTSRSRGQVRYASITCLVTGTPCRIPAASSTSGAMRAVVTALWDLVATLISRRRAAARARRSTRASDTSRMMVIRGGKQYHWLPFRELRPHSFPLSRTACTVAATYTMLTGLLGACGACAMLMDSVATESSSAVWSSLESNSIAEEADVDEDTLLDAIETLLRTTEATRSARALQPRILRYRQTKLCLTLPSMSLTLPLTASDPRGGSGILRARPIIFSNGPREFSAT